MSSASTSRWKCSPSPAIAICHFGLFRDLQHTLPSLRVNVHAALEKQLGGIDIFVHALLVSKLVNLRSHEDVGACSVALHREHSASAARR